METAGYLSFISPPGAGWQLLWGYHTHSGDNCCSMDFKQTWNRVSKFMALSCPMFCNIPPKVERIIESTLVWFCGLDLSGPCFLFLQGPALAQEDPEPQYPAVLVLLSGQSGKWPKHRDALSHQNFMNLRKKTSISQPLMLQISQRVSANRNEPKDPILFKAKYVFACT